MAGGFDAQRSRFALNAFVGEHPRLVATLSCFLDDPAGLEGCPTSVAASFKGGRQVDLGFPGFTDD